VDIGKSRNNDVSLLGHPGIRTSLYFQFLFSCDHQRDTGAVSVFAKLQAERITDNEDIGIYAYNYNYRVRTVKMAAWPKFVKLGNETSLFLDAMGYF
jgi:hypothetical protein